MNGWNATRCRRRLLIHPALIVFLAGVLFGMAPSAAETSAAPSVDCAGWSSDSRRVVKKFYKDITPARVLACIEAGADPNARLSYQLTPLHIVAAVPTKNAAVIATFVAAGADPNARGPGGLTPLHLVAGKHDTPPVIVALAQAGADPNARAEVASGRDDPLDDVTSLHDVTPLHVAARWSQSPAVIAALLEVGADPDARNKDGDTPLDLAESANRPAEIIAALKEGARTVEEIDSPAASKAAAAAPAVDCAGWDSNEEERLQSFYKEITPEGVIACLEAGADPNVRLVDAATPLHFAAHFNTNPAVIRALLDAGVDPSAQSNNGITPLHGAATFNGNPAIISVLLEGGAEPNAKAAMLADYTPLHLAARQSENPAIIAALLDGGADPNARGTNRATPLHLAAERQENPSVITALVRSGASPNARAVNDLTPLHLAARRNQNPDVIDALLDAGADRDARDEDWLQPRPTHD